MAIEYWVFARVITLDSTNNTLSYNANGAGPNNCVLDVGDYFLDGTGGVGDDLAGSLDNEMDATGPDGYAVGYQGRYAEDSYTCHATIATDGTSIQILGSSTLDLTLLGLPQSDTSTLVTIPSSQSSSATWVASQPVVADDQRASEFGVDVFETSQRQRYYFTRADEKKRLRLTLSHIEQSRMFDFASTSDTDRPLQEWWRNARNKRFRVYKTTASDSTKLTTLTSGDLVGTYEFVGDSAIKFAPTRMYDGTNLYAITFDLAEYVA